MSPQSGICRQNSAKPVHTATPSLCTQQPRNVLAKLLHGGRDAKAREDRHRVTHHGDARSQPPAEAQELAGEEQAGEAASRAAGRCLVAAHDGGCHGEEAEEDDAQQGQADGDRGQIGSALESVGGILELALVQDRVEVAIVARVVGHGRRGQVPARQR